MALSRKKPVGYPEISFLSFDVLDLLARIKSEMGLDAVGPVTFSLQTMETLACIRWEHGKPGGDIFFHSLFNRPDVPQPVIEHVLRHELLHLKIRPRKIDGKPFQALHVFLRSLRTTPEALVKLVRDRWSIENWHWIRDTQRHEDANRYRGNGAGVMATLRTTALNLLRLAGFRSIRAGLQAVMHDITALLAMAMRRPEPDPC